MRIVFLTPGTGSFYCGTCMRDNSLAVALRKLGHDALMVPLYLPPALDEESAAEGAPLLYGGINAWLQQKSALFRKTPRWIDSLFDSKVALGSAAKRAGMTQPQELGDLTLSMLKGEEGNQRKELDKLVRWLKSDGRADVICLSNALLMGLAREIKRRTGAKVFCTLQGEDYFLDLLNEPYRSECWDTLAERANDLDGFIAVSRYYADVMTRRARLPEDRVHVVHNGILLEGYEQAVNPPNPPAIGYLARMCEMKGLHTLIEAFIQVRKRGRVPNVKLRIAGTKTAGDEAYVAKCVSILQSAGLTSEAEFLPNLSREEKAAFLKSLSVLSVPATYGESFGLYVLESLATGVPVVQPDHAAFPELIEATGGGLLCKPDDPGSLADRLEELLLNPARARELGEHGRQAVHERFSVNTMAEGVLQVFTGAVVPTTDRLPIPT